MRRYLGVGAITLVLVMSMALPALADEENGYKSCSASSHVYTKAVFQHDSTMWLNVDGQGSVDRSITYGPYSPGWYTRYLNAWGHTTVSLWINSSYYHIYGWDLDYVASWPGCEAD